MGRPPLPPQTERKCHYCKLVKPIDNFYKEKSRKDNTGRSFHCKECNSIKTRESNWRKDLKQKGIKKFLDKTLQLRKNYVRRVDFILEKTDDNGRLKNVKKP